jgi:hypothetical protein
VITRQHIDLAVGIRYRASIGMELPDVSRNMHALVRVLSSYLRRGGRIQRHYEPQRCRKG